MNRLLKTAAAVALVAGTAQAEVAPTEVAFDEYGEVAESLTGVPGDPAEGIKVMTNRGLGNCIACHMSTELQDFPFHGEVGPSLDGAGDRWTEAQLRGIVANAKHTFPDSIMPSFYFTGPYVRQGDAFTGKAFEGELPPLLTAQQVEDVVAYLLTLDKYYD